jgi:hypothetical protein
MVETGFRGCISPGPTNPARGIVIVARSMLINRVLVAVLVFHWAALERGFTAYG